MIDIFSLTQPEYVEAVFASLGKGRQLAALVYALWFKEGRNPSLCEVTRQEESLLEKILSLTDFSISSTFEQRGSLRSSKWIQTFSDQLQSESVEIEMTFGITLCLSSQVGCRMGCAFCETGRLGLIRSLSVKEIVLQLFFSKVMRKLHVRNLVFMGMGEPFDNYEAVKQALRIFTDPFGFALGPSRITVSTSGLVDVLRRFTAEINPCIKLAISVNGPNDRVRSKVMPVNRQFAMPTLKQALLEYQSSSPKRTLLFEYVLLAGITDLPEMADELAQFAEGFLDLRINVIPYNPQSRATFKTPSAEATANFMDRLRQFGLKVYLRGTKGEKEMAACGQLGNLGLRSIKLSSML